ncbi:MAG: hypothetical protein ACXWQO_01225 [Bdellovibrionota bacterium]
MKTLLTVLGLCLSINAHAEGCYAYGRSYVAGESDCDGRVCQEDGTWNGVVKSGVCDVNDGTSRDPASVKHKKKKHPKKKKTNK